MKQNANQESLIVFLHIPKTAGTSLSHLLRQKFKADSITQIYKPSDCARPLADHAAGIDDSIKCLSGHIDYGIHEHLSRGCAYLSMVRNPISRVLSHYNFTKSKDPDAHPLGEAVEYAQNHTVVEYLERFPAISFEQIRVLSGIKSFDHDALNVAKDNVSSGKILVGLTEDYFHSSEMLFHDIGLGYPRFPLKRKNTTASSHKSKRDTFPDKATLAAIEEICALDIELYQHVQSHEELRKQSYSNIPRTRYGQIRHAVFRAYCRFLD